MKAILQELHALLHASTLEEVEEEADEDVESVLFPVLEADEASVLVELDAESVLLPELVPDEDASVLVPVADAEEDASVLVALDALSVLVAEDEVPSALVVFEALEESVLDVAADVDAGEEAEEEELPLSELDELDELEELEELELLELELELLELLEDVVSRATLTLLALRDQAEPEKAEPPGVELADKSIESALAGDVLVRDPES